MTRNNSSCCSNIFKKKLWTAALIIIKILNGNTNHGEFTQCIIKPVIFTSLLLTGHCSVTVTPGPHLMPVSYFHIWSKHQYNITCWRWDACQNSLHQPRRIWGRRPCVYGEEWNWWVPGVSAWTLGTDAAWRGWREDMSSLGSCIGRAALVNTPLWYWKWEHMMH